MTELVRIAPGALTIGRPLPWDVYDADGNILLRQGYVIQTDSQLEQLFERGRFKPRKIERPQEETFEDTRDRNPFADYPDLLHSLEATLKAITDSDPSAQKRLLGLARMIERTCTESPDATLALVHLYSIGPVIHEQILFYAILCQFIGRQFGLEEKRVAVLTAAALTANLALVPIADKLNASNTVLNDEQRGVIRKHPERSIQALQAAGIDNKLLLTIIAQHHEQADGSGYPKGLSGTEIRPEAEILALAERYVAMITKRAYRQRMNVADARKLIANLADGKFRPAIPKALLQILGEYPPGILVRLENNEVGVVTRRPVRARGPFVKAIFGPRGNRYTGTFERDTSEPDFGIQSLEEPEVMPSMDFSLVWGFRS
ncbi:MAG: HD-GYP domain-containing protein [Marinobacter adhaerens]|uniref:HD-GYP domain-containing protein n=1 Tax=Marinobacter adhaerens TaxID=1033846 RepID=UPI00078794A3|nr:HD domain-containing phosphohydrolase [Marinobacter adhaerens]MBW3227491.1 HD domain-containing protein [Marinobacter adhaerens]MCR9188153.1 HD domain-containing protein [Alteromonadaceae bacterium]MEC7727533.1 HD domain-containing phosphohydrolase [Pseudomonadota bacterium]